MPAEPGGGRSVRRLLGALVAFNLAVMLAVGFGGIVGAVRAHNSVQLLTDRVEPAVDANFRAFQSLLDSETHIRGWALSGDPAFLAEYDAAVSRFAVSRRTLDRLSRVDPQVELLVDDFALAADTWLTAYAEPRLRAGADPDVSEGTRFRRGLMLFAEVRRAHAAVTEELDGLSQRLRDSAGDRLRNVVIALTTLAVSGAVIGVLVGLRIARRVTRPLGELEETANRLARGEYDARAAVGGPREVAQVASAVNRMADENDRARAVESHVVEQLRALDAVKSDFVSNVSHELRTPLTSILGYVELLEEELADRSDIGAERGMIAATKRNVARLSELIDDLLDLTRSEGRITDFAPVDLAALTRDIVTDLRVASAQEGVDIRLGLPGAPVIVLADAGQMTRVVTNLVSNAVKFSEGAAEVAVTVVADDLQAVLAVQDHGIGIPESAMGDLGSRFYRAANAVDKGITGTGLGLRIVQAIVENHHGIVDVRSEEGVGTTVWVRIPLAEQAGP
ncbi:MAG TPA: ATP-binding protein [Marmoricola sp.]